MPLSAPNGSLNCSLRGTGLFADVSPPPPPALSQWPQWSAWPWNGASRPLPTWPEIGVRARRHARRSCRTVCTEAAASAAARFTHGGMAGSPKTAGRRACREFRGAAAERRNSSRVDGSQNRVFMLFFARSSARPNQSWPIIRATPTNSSADLGGCGHFGGGRTKRRCF